MNHDDLKKIIRDIPDFPKPGIIFKDITPVLKNAAAFNYALNVMQKVLDKYNFDYIAGIESRGFIFGAALAEKINRGFIPIRKPGKLPYKSFQEEYTLEYGTNMLEIHQDAVSTGDAVAVVDDLLATGGTALAANRLIERCGGRVAVDLFLIELSFLKGRALLKDVQTETIISY